MEIYKGQKAQATCVFRVHAVLISCNFWSVGKSEADQVGGDFLVPEIFGDVSYKQCNISTFFVVGHIPVFNQIIVVSIYPKRSEL